MKGDIMKDKTKKTPEVQQFHFFAASSINWHVSDDLLHCLMMQKKADSGRSRMYKSTSCSVYRVPLPKSAHYQIDNFKPDVEGTEFTAKVIY